MRCENCGRAKLSLRKDGTYLCQICRYDSNSAFGYRISPCTPDKARYEDIKFELKIGKERAIISMAEAKKFAELVRWMG
jgi:uncharacterized Zn finger protein (UPF0148 family)